MEEKQVSGTKQSKINLWMVLAGVAVAVGFFLPLISVGGLQIASGWDMLWSDRIAFSQKAMVAMYPIGGVALMVTALAGVRSARWFALGLGGLIILWPAYKLFRAFIEVAGSGAFLVLGGGLVALVSGLVANTKKK
jgi:hypothetical protein